MILSYQINARTELAIRYNDISPLENHHCAITFQIMDKVCTVLVIWDSMMEVLMLACIHAARDQHLCLCQCRRI